MSGRSLTRAAALGCAALLALAGPLAAGTAAAITAPVVDPAAVPPDTPPGPDEPLRMEHNCTVPGVVPGSDLGAPSPSQAFMDIPSLWKAAASRGAGVTVAMIDTGVNVSPRLSRVHGGGDYVDPAANGLADCDVHGTIVAGIIGAAPAETDGMSGVAPEADIVSIRQSSAAYGPANPSPGDAQADRRAGTVSTLARAVVHAANSGARVLNMSIVACIPVLKPVDQTTLGAALRYAAVDKDVVIVAASGNLANQDCAQNPDIDATNGKDPRNWGGVVTISTPSWFSDYVLSVSATDGTGRPAVDDQGREISLSGPWVGVAAPGVFAQGFDDKGGLINATFDAQASQFRAINGTSFSAAYVSGLAALVRAKYPRLSAAQVINRIEATAHSPAALVDNRVGYGVIDPLAALNNDVPEGPPRMPEHLSRSLEVPPPPPPPDRRPMYIALVGSGALVGAVLLAVFVSNTARERRS
ncbi:type VII secretion-associated serine protease mycosin [Mycolicibacterium arenosum]|uniref:Type VII secretion-associated serine protease mycosin n=1 Tax=Mycolicibacterium arenosum TaxID=2952157 RepID=A0ABT1MCL3_9MYCO|nr:type VII secretion-associated serine protease mycosin [Mycolicibacterium sp. CAU 1645]MCP9276916.1 type VII secretion-associated serine protease mycosin [Mycolicibacterium sp. CAU 1645]